MGKKFKRYISTKQFNHFTIGLLLSHQYYAPIFTYFLDWHVLNWLGSSKVENPAAHRIMI